MGTKTRDMMVRLVPVQHMGKASRSPLGPINRKGESDKSGAPRSILLVASPSKPDNLATTIKPCSVLK